MFHNIILGIIVVAIIAGAGAFIEGKQRKECLGSATNQFELDRCDRLYPKPDTVIVL